MQIDLNEKSKQSIKEVTGMSCDEIMALDNKEITARIEKKIGKKLTFLKTNDERLLSRGSVYAFFNRFIDFDRKKIDKKLDKIIKSKRY